MADTRRNEAIGDKMKASITAFDYALPTNTLENEELAREFAGWSAEKIFSKTGIRIRHIVEKDQCASDLAIEAANKLFCRGICSPDSIDYLLFCTQSPDYLLPTTACIIQHRLGLPTSCGALDFNLGCSGFIYGLGLAKALIESGQAKNILLLTADTYSKFINPMDKSVRTLFGDAAAATFVTAIESETPLIGPFVYGTDGSGAENFIVPTSALRSRFDAGASLHKDESGNSRTVNDIFMNGPEIFNFTLRVVPGTVSALLRMGKLRIDEIDLFIFHQANRFMLDHLQKKLNLPPEKFVISMEDVGNTVSCSIPIACKMAVDGGKLKPDALLMLVGFGVGYSWGGALVHYLPNG